MAQNQPGDLVRFSDSGFVGFGLYRFRYRVYRQEQFLARSGEFWLKSGQIQSGRIRWDLAGSIEIRPWFRQLMARSCQILSGMLNISSEMLKVSKIWSGMLNISRETLEVSVRVGPHGFWNAKPTTDPLKVGFDNSKLASDRQCLRIGWRQVGLGRVGRVGQFGGSPG